MLLSHDHHDDNLDPAGRALLPSAGVVVTTAPGREAARRSARAGWSRGRPPGSRRPDRPTIEITATPCRHGPPLSHPIVGDVIGFALRWEGQEHGVLWISGDTVLYDGVREVAEPARGGHRAPAPRRRAVPGVGAAALHDDRRDAVELCGLVHPRTVIPIHYEGWKHFRQGREAIEREFAQAPEDFRESVRWLPIGERVALAAS